MKKVELRVILTFADDNIKGTKHLKEIAERVANTLKEESNSGNGLAPESADTYTESVYVNTTTAPEHRVEWEVKSGLGWVRTI